MQGWVVAVKEIIDVTGVETTANTQVELPDRWRFPQHDAPVIARLRAAGAVIGAKTPTHEFAWGITTAQPDRVQAVNPRAPGRVTGGSSGGAAAMVARGEARLGVGTDTGGSVRIPSAWCGLVGWKPTQSLVPTSGVLPLAPSLDHVGFIAADVTTLFPIAELFGVRIPADVTRAVRVAPGRSDAVADAASHDACEVATGRLARLGQRYAGIDLAPAATVTAAYRAIQMREALAVHRHLFGTWPSQRQRYAADVAPRLELAEQLSEADEVAARLAREEVRAAWLGVFAQTDVVVTPTTGCAPPFVAAPDVAEVDGVEMPLRDVVLPHTVPANLAGLPVVCVPVGTGTPADGLRSVQLIGAPGSDGLLLCAAVHVLG
jgi:aspartyl-tRNA(Asn)/glutamyl-tRNA(Gln) amidotransferase subunit A